MPEQTHITPEELKPQQQATAPQVQGEKTDVESILRKTEKQKQPKPCCGKLPCKGTTANCFYCTECLDCITGNGCGHDPSTHDPLAFIIEEE